MVIKSIEDLQLIKQFISENEYLAFDIETNSLQPRGGKIIGFGVSNADVGFYVVHLEWNGSELVEVIPFDECVEIIKSLQDSKWVGWNGSFEVRFCRHYFGVDLAPSMWSDGMLAKHTVNEERPFSLKEVAKIEYGTSAVEEQLLMKESIKANGGNPSSDYFMADVDITGTYCIKDCLLTYRLNDKYVEQIKSQNLTQFFFKDEVMPLYKEVIIDMEDNGVVVDLDLLKKSQNEIIIDIAKLHSEIQADIKPMLGAFTTWYLGKELPPKRTGEFAQYICRYADLDLPETKSGRFSVSKPNLEKLDDSVYKDFLLGGEYLSDCIVRDIQDLWFMDQEQEHIFNIASKHHLKRLYFDELGETPISKTAKGNPQVDNLFLFEMGKKYEWTNKIVNFNKLNKIKGTYIDNYLDSSIDGVFYPGWFMHRTTSGRLGGNLMQMPRQLSEGAAHPMIVKYTNVIRNCIVAGDKHKLIGADYSSLEIVVFADDAKEDNLLDMIRNNEDFYSKVYIDIFNLHDKYSADKSADNFFKTHEPDLRQSAKSYSLGLRYNMQAFALSKTLDIEQKAAQDIIDKYFKAYPKLRNRMDELIEQAKTDGFVKSKAGRIRHLPLLKKLAYSHGDELMDSLKLWKKYHDCPKKYSQMKFLGKQYKAAINNCLNFPIQSMAASITNRACIAIHKEFKRVGVKAAICMQIHDELVVRCRESDVDKVSKIMRYLMENTTKLGVPLNAEPEVGDRYGEIK